VEDWLVVMRPIRATKPSCLGCHAGAKPGDTLGAMVYTVQKSLLTAFRAPEKGVLLTGRLRRNAGYHLSRFSQ